ncbi:MAG: hypothetical protein AAGG38_14850 [Planctomycetota bacterium]
MNLLRFVPGPLALAATALAVPLLTPAPAASAGEVTFSVTYDHPHPRAQHVQTHYPPRAVRTRDVSPREARYWDSPRHRPRVARRSPVFSDSRSSGRFETVSRRRAERTYHAPRQRTTRTVWVEPRYETRYDRCGRPIRVCVRAGYYKEVEVCHDVRPRHRHLVHHRSSRSGWSIRIGHRE